MHPGTEVIDPAPPVYTDSGGGGGWAWLMTARGIMEAELIKGALEAAGIVEVFLDTRDPSPGAWLFMSGNVNALVRIFVPKVLLDDARLVLLEAGFTQEQPELAQPVRTRGARAWVWVLIAVLLVALFLVATVRGSVIG